MVRPESFETFVRNGQMELFVAADGEVLRGAEAAPVLRRLWDHGALYGSAPDVKYRLEDGLWVTDPADVPPGAAIKEMQVENVIRVTPSFLD